MITDERRCALLPLATKLAERLAQVQTATGGGKPYDRSKLAIVSRFLQSRMRDPEAMKAQPFKAAVTEYLKRLPGSHHSAISRSARPQLEELAKRLGDIVAATREEEELIHVLRWTERLLFVREKQFDGPADREDYGGRGYGCHDPQGHLWSFGTFDPWAAPAEKH